MRNYPEDPDLAYGSATTADLQAHLEATSGLTSPAFGGLVHGEGYPSYTTISVAGCCRGGHGFAFPSHLSPSVDFFELPVPLHFIGERYGQHGGIEQHHQQPSSSTSTSPFAVDSVAFDPECWLISAQNFTTTVQDLKADPATLALFPNPAKDRITWNAPNSFREQTARVLDALGRVVLTAHAKTGSLDISGLTNGSYVLELRGTSGPLRARFVKE